MVASIGTFAQNEILRRRSQEAQLELNTLQTQVSSGRKADTFSGLGEGARYSLNLRQSKQSTEAFISTNRTTDIRMQQMQATLERIKDIANDVKISAFAGVSSASTPAAQGNFTIRTTSRGAIAEISQLLNSQIDGFYLFAGRRTDAPPMIDPGGIGETGTPLGNAAALAATLPLANDQTSGDALYDGIVTHLDGGTVGGVAGADPVRYYDGEHSADGGSLLVARIDANTDIAYGTTGRDDSVAKIMQALYALSVAELTPTSEAGYRQVALRAVADLEAGFNGIVEEIGDLGVKQTQLEDVTTRQQDFITTLDLQLGAIEDVDMSEALSKLSAAQTQLEASYRMIALMRELSITKYL
jgi:flagellar hook-associated protein 3 FlgL